LALKALRLLLKTQYGTGSHHHPEQHKHWKIILDGVTGLIREKTITIESNGNTEAMGGSVPVSSKTTILIKVSPE
jgi:hypothetical protein